MAVSNQQILNLLKVTYPNVRRRSVRSQASTVLNEIPIKKWLFGNDNLMRFSLSNGNSAVGSNYAALVAGTTYNDLNQELQVGARYLTSYFTVDQGAVLATSEDYAAYQDIISDRMFTTFDTLNKRLAAHFYGGQFGILASAPATTLSAGSNTVTFPTNTALALDVGSTFQVNVGTYAGTSILGPYTVTAKQGNEITFTAGSADTWTADDFIALAFTQNAGTALAPEGLLDFIPSLGGRTGAAWNTLISTPYRNINRAASVDQYAGHYGTYSKTSTEDLAFSIALQELLMKIQNYGARGENTLIVLAPENWLALSKELQLFGQRNVVQNGQIAERIGGHAKLGAVYEEMLVPSIRRDPRAPSDKVYFIPKEEVSCYDMGVAEKVILPQEALGKPDPTSVGSQGVGPEIKFGINIGKIFTIEQGTPGIYGPVARIAAHLFNNYVLLDASQAAVLDIVA
jgi:hypothetical protein